MTVARPPSVHTTLDTVEADMLEPPSRPTSPSRRCLAGGGALQPVTLRYAVYGDLDAGRDNVILVCHALSGSARVGDWWAELFGAGPAVRPVALRHRRHQRPRLVLRLHRADVAQPATGRPYGGDFPVVSIHDMVRAQARLLDHLGIERLHAVVGGSIGGMQALAWARRYPERVPRCIAIGAAR